MGGMIMSYIYKITNNINNKIYVGKTNLSIQKRFQQHCRDYKKKSTEKRPLYQAMQKYGIEHFYIEKIEECSPELASEKEQYWIAFYKGYEQGYNATRGGDGKQLFNHFEIAKELIKNPYPKKVADKIGCSVGLVYIVAKEYKIQIKNYGQKNVNSKKNVHQYDKITKQYIQTFDSTQKAAEWLKNNMIITTINSGVRSHISEVARGLRKSAYGYIWKYNLGELNSLGTP